MDRIPDDQRLCYCLGKDYGEVRACLRETSAQTVDDVTRATGAGGGCRTCHPEIEALIEERRALRAEHGFLAAIRRIFVRS